MKLLSKDKVITEFGCFIREAREKRGLTQAEVAEQLSMSRSYYAMIETGSREIYFTVAMNICSVLGEDINEFAKRLK